MSRDGGGGGRGVHGFARLKADLAEPKRMLDR